jgi:hypothetical protein
LKKVTDLNTLGGQWSPMVGSLKLASLLLASYICMLVLCLHEKFTSGKGSIVSATGVLVFVLVAGLLAVVS